MSLANLAAAAAAVPVALPLASDAELVQFHVQLRALELDNIYELIAGRLAKNGWRQMLSYDPKDPFSVADAEALIQKTRVHVADLDMDEAKFKKKLGDWIRSSGRTYLQRLTDAFGGITTP